MTLEIETVEEKRIVVCAFNLKRENAYSYRKYKTIEGAANRFKELLGDPNVDFLSIRIIRKKVNYS